MGGQGRLSAPEELVPVGGDSSVMNGSWPDRVRMAQSNAMNRGNPDIMVRLDDRQLGRPAAPGHITEELAWTRRPSPKEPRRVPPDLPR
ncbi:hypothetical protein FB465_1825 [Kitasatospora atroaurantiaca]|uniref:Uncharacterized protein n=1 Tax=Kitasatospora atroaurantiaca TaxID=285545 RepID=A0A561EMI7_9ACTN|nr:hypothetical protein FB465_1825 [Kitasatospora atroaurantiaca]